MSDDEISDDMQELNELIAEIRSKDEEQQQNDDCNQEIGDENGKKCDQNKTENILLRSVEVPMDKVIFGDKSKLIKNLEKAVSKSVKYGPETESVNEENECNNDNPENSEKRKPAWHDSDDEETKLSRTKSKRMRISNYKEYLTTKFTRIVSQPKWSSLDGTNSKGKDSDDEDEKLLRTVGFLNKSSESILTSGHLHLKKMKDLNCDTYSERLINSIQFHPSSTAALVAGENGVATIYGVDGIQNDKLHSLHIPKFPIRCARILPCGTKAVFGSVTQNAYFYDLMSAKETCYKFKREYGNLSNFEVSRCGRYLVAAGLCGEIHIYEAKSFEIIKTLQQNDNISSICFTADSRRLIVSGCSSNVCIFSMRQQKLEHTFIDDGCIQGGAMDLSPNQRLLATGSREGAVNVYDFDKVMVSKIPQPEKTFLNITTGISCVRFNHSSELLAFSSFLRPNAVKIAHFPSATVFANFPCYMSKLGSVRTLEFSPQSAYFTIGTRQKCPLFRIKHFENY